MKHILKDGTRMDIRKMTNSHLLNTIRLLQRTAAKGIVYYCYKGTFYKCEEEIVRGDEALKKLHFNHYAKELKRRGLELPTNEEC